MTADTIKAPTARSSLAGLFDRSVRVFGMAALGRSRAVPRFSQASD
jgi:hypothetical protein